MPASNNRVAYSGIQIERKNPEYINDFSRTLLEGFYMRDGESPSQALARAATAFCFGDYDLAQRIYNYAYNNWMMYASPVLSNAPKGHWIPDYEKDGAHYWYTSQFIAEEKRRGLPISCFAFDVPDTAQGQVETIQELATLSMAGGGTGAHNSIRGVSKKAPGPIPYMKVLDGAIGYFKQNLSRKGALAYYMSVDHPDIMEHIRFRVPGGDPKRRSDNRTQFHNAVNLTDEFIQAVFEDKEIDLVCPHTGRVYDRLSARGIWEDILETRALTGEPYLMKIDLANRKMPETQKALGLRINGSNLCVAPETLVLTSKGHLPISSLKDQEVEVWNGEEFSQVTVRQTGSDQELLKVVLNDGREIECTPYHKFYAKVGEKSVKVEASQLESGVVLEGYVGPNGEPEISSIVSSVIRTGRIADTFCFTEPKREKGVFNGILTGNCSEITLPTDEDRTFVCCLSSLNLAKYDEWKDTTIVEDMIRFLDNVLEYFIINSPDSLSKARYSAERERALGLGTFGWHSLLQSRMIPFESGGFGSAVQLNHEVFSLIKKRAVEESKRLAAERGEAPDMKGTGMRNSRLLAIAPNANSADLANASPSIEPWYRNCFVKDSRAGAFFIKNPYLEALLESKGLNTRAVWKDIDDNDGSVQHMEELTEHEKSVFKTAREMDQHWLIEHADQRGQYVCQAQSLNVYFPAGASRQYVNSVHLKFLKAENVVTMYYFRTEREAKVDKVKEIERKALVDWSGETCVACQG
jgi:ribonucleotide reductase alpha subunit